MEKVMDLDMTVVDSAITVSERDWSTVEVSSNVEKLNINTQLVTPMFVTDNGVYM